MGVRGSRAWDAAMLVLASILASMVLYFSLVRGPAATAGLLLALLLAYTGIKAWDKDWSTPSIPISARSLAASTALLLAAPVAAEALPLHGSLILETLVLAARFTALFLASGLAAALMLGLEKWETLMALAHPLSAGITGLLLLAYMAMGADLRIPLLVLLAALLAARIRGMKTIYRAARIDLLVVAVTAALPLTYIALTGPRLPMISEDTQRDVYYSLRASMGYRDLSPFNLHWYIYTPVLRGLVKAAPLAIYPALLTTALQLSALYFLLIHYAPRKTSAAGYALFLTGMSTPPLLSLVLGENLYLPLASSPHLPFSYIMLAARYKYYFTGLLAALLLPVLPHMNAGRRTWVTAAGILALAAALHPLSLAALPVFLLAYAAARMLEKGGLAAGMAAAPLILAAATLLLMLGHLNSLMGSGVPGIFARLKIASLLSLSSSKGKAAAVSLAAGIPVATAYLALRSRRASSLPLILALSTACSAIILAENSYSLYMVTATLFPWKLDPPPALLAATYAPAIAVAAALMPVGSRVPPETRRLLVVVATGSLLLLALEYLQASYLATRLSHLASLPLALYTAHKLAGMRRSIAAPILILLVAVFALHPAIIMSAKTSRNPGYTLNQYLELAGRVEETGRAACIVTHSVIVPGPRIPERVLPQAYSSNQTAYLLVLQQQCRDNIIVVDAGRQGLSGFPGYLYSHGHAYMVAPGFYAVEQPRITASSQLCLAEEPWRYDPGLYQELLGALERGEEASLKAPWDKHPCSQEALTPRSPMIAGSIRIHAEKITVHSPSAYMLGKGSPMPTATRLVFRDTSITLTPANYTFYAQLLLDNGTRLVARTPRISAWNYTLRMMDVYLRPTYNAALNHEVLLKGERLVLQAAYSLAPGTQQGKLVFGITEASIRWAENPLKQIYLARYAGEALETGLLALPIAAALGAAVILRRGGGP